MAKKSKGRQKIKMAKMENESNLQVTFSKRRSGLFKKASEISTLCGAELAIIVFSPGGKVFSFGHPNVDTILDRFLNVNHPSSSQNPNVQLNEMRRNSTIREMNNHLTQMMNELESERKKNEELKRIRKNSKKPMNWWEEPIEDLDLVQGKKYKGMLENLKNLVTFEASKFFQATLSHQNFYVGSSSNAPFRVDGGNNINPNLDQFGDGRMHNMNAFYNQNIFSPNHPLSYGNNNQVGGFASEYNVNYGQENNHIQSLGFKEENISENEHRHHDHPPHSGSDYN